MADDIKVWLIEDSGIYRKGLARAINSAEHMICENQFNRAEEALDEIKSGQKPDVLFLDVGLPGMSGLDALEVLQKSNPEEKPVHPIILSH